MALIDNSTTNNQAQPGRQQTASPGTTNGEVWSFHKSNLLNSPVAAGIGGEYFTKIRAALVDIYKDLAEGIEVSILSLNRQNPPGLRFSALVVACTMPSVNAAVTAYHTLVLEATGEKLMPVNAVIDNQNIQVHRVTSDAMDEIMQRLAHEAVTAEFPTHMVYPADAMVLPARVDPTQKEILENVARNAALACVSVINSATDNFGKLNLAYMDRDCRFAIDVAFGNHQVTDIVGNPQRSSVLINFSSQLKTAQSFQKNLSTVNTQDSVAQICELSAFVNPIWAPVAPQNGIGFNQHHPNIPQPTNKFAAELVVTNIRTNFATSPAAVLLALSSCLALVDNNTWIQAFLPKVSARTPSVNDKVDITDIGALNITANIANEQQFGGFGRPMDIADMKGDILKINRYLTAIFRPAIIVSIDCPESCPESWYLTPFSAAASGDQDAYAAIYAAAQELTNGNFGRFFKEGDPMFTNIVRVPLGHYVVGDKVQDIRNIDYTAIANLYQNNPQIINEFCNTFVSMPGAVPIRNLATREGLIRDALHQQCTIDGYAARVSCSGIFIESLSKAIAECGLPVTVNTPLNADQLRTGTLAPNFISGSLSMGTHTWNQGFQARPMQQYRFTGNRSF